MRVRVNGRGPVLSALGAVVLMHLAVAAAAGSDDLGTWYFGITSGPQWRAEASDSAGSTDFDTGFTVNGTLGHRFSDFRTEAEFSYLVNNLKSTDPASPFIDREPSDGDADIRGLFVNLCYDIPIRESKVKPYAAVGLGGHKVSVNGLTTPSLRTLPPEYGGPVVVYAESDWTFVYQLKGGIAYTLSPRTELIAGYRYLRGSDLDINLLDGSTIHPDAKIHAIEAGFRITFK